jgi:DNA polymerase (family X)
MIKLDFHIHTTWSDGHQSIGEMLNACEVMKLEKVALTDHYKSGAKFDLSAYCAEIDSLKSEYPFTILKGVELQWTADCLLDYFSKKERDYLDFTLCELMGDLIFNPQSPRWEHERREKTKLLETAFYAYFAIAEHPYVDIIAHPFNFGQMKGLAYDFELNDIPRNKLHELAGLMKEHDTAYEIQSQFYYWFPKMRIKKLLQQQVEIIKIFKDAGVRFSVGTDAHDVGTTGNTRWATTVMECAGVGREDLIGNSE